ncbi:MAG: hypothetical protein WA659_05165 [Candidatus Aquirickettsiella sp.]
MPLNSQESTKESNLLDDLSEILKGIDNLPEHDSSTLSKQELEFSTQEFEFDDDDLLINHIPPLDDSNEKGMTTEELIHNLSMEYSVDKNEKIQKLEKKNQELNKQIKVKDQQIKNLTEQDQQEISSLAQEQIKLNKKLKTAQSELEKSKLEITRLQSELKEKKDNITKLEDEKKQHVESLIVLNKDLGDLQAELETTRENSTKIQAKLDQANQNLTQSKEEIDKLFNDNKKLKNKIKILQQNDSDLQNKCDTLEETVNTKTKEIDDLKNRIGEIQQQLKLKKIEVDNLSKQITASENNKQILEQQLQELKDKESRMPPIQDAPDVSLDLHLNNINKKSEEVSPSLSDSSSSLSTTSPTHTSASVHSHSPFHSASSLSEDDSGLANSAFSLNHSSPLILPRSQSLPNFIITSESIPVRTHSDSTNSDLINFTNSGPSPTLIKGGMSMSFIQEQIDSFLSNSEFKNYLINRLAAEFEAAYVDAFRFLLDMPEYSGVDSASLLASKSESKQCNLLINDAVTRMLSNEATQKEIKNALTLFVSQAGQSSLSIEETAEKLLVEISNDNFIGINQQTKENYNESYQILLQASKDNKSNAQQYVALLKLCGEQILSAEKKEDAKSYIINDFKNGLNAINVNSDEYREKIKNTASKLTTEIFNTENMLKALEKAKVNNLDSNDQLNETKNILNNQRDEKIKNIIEDNFAYIFIDCILEKINNGVRLSDDEIQKIPSELQYADTVNEFVSGLQVKYPHLSAFEEDDNNFKQLRLISRKKTLSAINQTLINDNEIIDLDSDAWLEKKLQLITGKSISLELFKLEKEQENLLNELRSTLHLSTLYDIAITSKTISELTNEIDKVNKAQLSAAEQISQIFQEIDRKQAAYPKLIDDKAFAGFRANLNQHLENSSINLEVDEEAAKILLMGINQRLKKDISKWGLLDNKFQKEITNDILINLKDLGFDKSKIETLVHHAMLVLRNNYPNDTVKKREQWLKDITLLHLATKELLAFSGKIEKNKAKFLDLKELKKQDPASQDPKEKISDVYLPRSCTLVANSSDSNFVPRDPVKNGFTVDTIFYKQNALEINQTLTFSQTLRNNKEIKWSVSRIDDTCLTYQTHKSWFDVIKSIKHSADNAMTYTRSNTDRQFNVEEEVLFTQLKHAINCSKSKICKITISKDCSKQKERFIRCFINYHNKNKSNAEPILECQDNDTLKIHEEDRINMMNKFETVSNIHAKELENVKKQSTELVNRHIRPRG